MNNSDLYTITIVRNIGIPISFTIKRRKILFYLILVAIISILLILGTSQYVLLKMDTLTMVQELKEVNAEKQLLAEQIKKLDHDRYWKNDEKRTTEISAVKSSLLNQPDFSTDGIWVTNRSTVSDKELQEGVTVELSKFSASVKGDDLNIGIVMQNTSSPRQAVGGYVCVTLVNNDQAPPLYKSVNKDELGESGYPSSYKSGSLYHISRRTSTKKMKFRLTEINEYYTDAMVFLYSYKGRLLNKKDVPLGKEIFLE
jgi:hypothetical protein